MFVHINSGEGVNQGFYHIEFDDGGTVLFQTPPGEVSGLAIGDRKYNIKGKSYIIDPKNQLFCTIAFEDESSIFSQNRWQFSDQM